MLYEINQGTFVEEKKTLFKDFAPKWLKLYSNRGNLKPGTIRVRRHEIDKLMPYFAYIKMKDITTNMYQEALDDLIKEYAYNTVKGINRTGRMIFKKAIELEVIKKDPTEFTSIKKPMKTIEELEENQIPKYMEKEELYLFLETAKKQGLEMDYLAFLILSYTGMRIGELVCLKWNDINFKENSIRIIKTYYNEKNNTVEFSLELPKTQGSIRTIVVEDMIMEELKKHRTAQKKVIKRLGDAYYNEGFIFGKSERHPGYPMLIKTVANRMKRLLKTAGLNQELTPHSLRHTHTSLLAEAGVGLEEIMDRLGHVEDETTRLIYLHVTEELKREASQKFGQLMRSLH